LVEKGRPTPETSGFSMVFPMINMY
jgi:hypothetical protein